MRTIIINGREMSSRAKAHAHLAERLLLPDYYGRNLDALQDCLGDISEQTHITVLHSEALARALGAYGAALLQILKHSAEESDLLTVSFHSDADAFEGELTE